MMPRTTKRQQAELDLSSVQMQIVRAGLRLAHTGEPYTHDMIAAEAGMSPDACRRIYPIFDDLVIAMVTTDVRTRLSIQSCTITAEMVQKAFKDALPLWRLVYGKFTFQVISASCDMVVKVLREYGLYEELYYQRLEPRAPRPARSFTDVLSDYETTPLSDYQIREFDPLVDYITGCLSYGDSPTRHSLCDTMWIVLPGYIRSGWTPPKP